MKFAARTLAFAAALISSANAGKGVDRDSAKILTSNHTGKVTHSNKPSKVPVTGLVGNAKKGSGYIQFAEKLTISGASDMEEVLIYSKKGVEVWARCQGPSYTPDLPGVSCNGPVCAQLYFLVDEPTEWYGGCENGDNSKPNLAYLQGVCAIIDSSGGSDVAEWYYGSSMQHKSGRYVYGDAMSTMTGQAPFGETNTCYFGGNFYDLFPKRDLTSSKY